MPNIDRYLSLITSQHQNKPKFKAWLSAPLAMLESCSEVAENLYTHFDLDTATGKQLDIMGQVVGVGRRVDFQPGDGSSPRLDDDTYRIVLKAKIIKNQWKGTLPELYDIWETLFSDAFIVLQDNQDMSIDALIIGLFSDLQRDLITHGYIIPKPLGVRINYIYSENPFFSYGLSNRDFKGYGEGYWTQHV